MKKEFTFEVGDMLPIAITIVIVGIAITYGISLTRDIREDAHPNCNTLYSSTGYTSWNESSGDCMNASNGSHVKTMSYSGAEDYIAANNSLTGIAKLPEKLPTIVTVIVAAIIIGILLRYFMIKY